MPAVALPVSEKADEPIEMTLEEFLAWDQDELGTGEKYEWVDGKIELAGYWMKADERHIVKRLTRKFTECRIYEDGGELFAETACVLNSNKTRVPDLAFFDLQQIKQSKEGGHPVPRWVIEIISPSDKAFALEKKVREYFDAGVEVIWQIFPELEHIRVYTGPDQVAQFSGDSICSANPALDDFEIKVSSVFRDWE